MNWSIDVILAIYPLVESFQALKKPRIAVLKHWIIFWIVWIVVHAVEIIVSAISYMTSWIPLVNLFFSLYNVLRILIIIINYSPHVTYITHRTVLKFGYSEFMKMAKRIKNSQKTEEVREWIDAQKNVLVNTRIGGTVIILGSYLMDYYKKYFLIHLSEDRKIENLEHRDNDF